MRGLFGSMTPRRKSGAGDIGGGAWFPFLGSVKSSSGIAVNQSTAMRCSTVFACVNIISEDVARAEPKLYRPLPDRTLSDGRKAPGGREQVTDHPLAKLFRRPNRVQDWFQFAGMMERAVELKSNAYAIVLRDRRGDPSELIPMNPDKVTVLEAADGSIFYQFAPTGLFELSILTKLPQTYAGFRVPSEHVFHMQDLGFNMLMGSSRIGFAADSIGLALGQEKQAGAWMQNGARPSVVLTTEGKLTDDAAKRMKAEWEEMNAGLANTGKTVVFEQGLKAQALSLSSVDLEFLNSRGFQVEDICRFFRVPPHKVAKTDRSTNNNIEAQDADYTNNTLSPKFTRWERRLEFHFGLDLEGLEVDFDLSDLFRASPSGRMLIARQGVVGGVLTQNQALSLYDPNLPMQPDGDRLLAPTNLAASGSQAAGGAPDDAGRPQAEDQRL
jgi:HK97 family phage portal protein